MGDASDIFKSMVRSAASDVFDRVRNAGVTKAVVQAVGDLRTQRSRIGAKELSAACAEIRGVGSITIGFVAGKLDIYIERDGASEATAAFQLEPASIRFAPRGAKEISFSVYPAEAASGPLTSDVVGCIAAEIASRVWSFAPGKLSGAAFADRHGERLSIDLRDTPTGRSLRGSPFEILAEAIELRALQVESDALVVQIGLPKPTF